MAQPNLTEALAERFKEILLDPEKGCNFISEQQSRDLPHDILRVFPRRESARRAQDRLVEDIKRRGGTVVDRTSYDEETVQASSGESRLASDGTTKKLSKKGKMVRRLTLFDKAVVQMTYNSDKFTQGQLAVVWDVPVQTDLDEWKPVKLLLGPVGTKVGPGGDESKEYLISRGWTEISVRKRTAQSWVRVGNGLLGRRTQYPFALRMAMTIHASMGATMKKLVTSVTMEGCDLWMSELVVVLLSRTTELRDIYFIGDANETVNKLLMALVKKNRFHKYMHQLLRNMGVKGRYVAANGGAFIDRGLLPWRPLDTDLPGNGVGVVYLLRSLRDGKSTYVGETRNLVKRISTHNSGHGSQQSCDPALRPWHVIGFICGFTNDTKEVRRHYERRWKLMRDDRGGNALAPGDMMDIGRGLTLGMDSEPNLRFVATGTFDVVANSNF